MKKINTIITILLTIILIPLFSIKIINQNHITSNLNNQLTQQTSNIIYIISGDESSTSGDGTIDNPYQSIEYAIEKASNGDTIKLLEDIIYRQPASNINFIIDKSLTIDGGNYTLTFRGSNLELLANVVFQNLTLNMIPDGTNQTKIYVSGNEVTFNNVSTLISQAQASERPTIIGGSVSSSKSGTHTKINILNGTSETRFKEIIAGQENSDSSIPVTINISSEYSKVDNGINLGGSNNYKVTGNINLTTNSKNIKKIDATNSTNNTITITDSTIYNLELTNIQNLILKNNADITLNSLTKTKGDIELKEGTTLWLKTPSQVEINNLKGTGELIISTDTNLLIKGDIKDASNIKLNGFESDLIKNINKVYIEVSGTINSNTNVSLYLENDYYLINKEGNKYRLIENNDFDKDNIKKIEVIQNPTKLSYIVGDTIDISGLILRLTDNNNNTFIVDYTNLNEYNISYTPQSKLTTNNKTITIQNNNIKTTILIIVSEKTTTKLETEKYTPTIESKTIKLNTKLEAKEFITNTDKLPNDTKYTFKKEPNFASIGTQNITIIITYSDSSKDTLSTSLTILSETTEDKEEQLPEVEEQLPKEENEKVENIVEEETPTSQNQLEENRNSNIKYVYLIFIIIVLIVIIFIIKFQNKQKEKLYEK